MTCATALPCYRSLGGDVQSSLSMGKIWRLAPQPSEPQIYWQRRHSAAIFPHNSTKYSRKEKCCKESSLKAQTRSYLNTGTTYSSRPRRYLCLAVALSRQTCRNVNCREGVELLCSSFLSTNSFRIFVSFLLCLRVVENSWVPNLLSSGSLCPQTLMFFFLISLNAKRRAVGLRIRGD